MNSLRPGLILLSVVAIGLFLVPWKGYGQDVDSEDPTSATEASATETSATEIREQTIYVPYAELRDVFEKEGRGVFLPYEQFKKLWESARKSESQQTPGGQTERQAPDAIISEITSEATVRKDVVHVEALLAIELLREGWNTVPLRLGDAAIQSAEIDGEVARVTASSDGGYQLVVENKSKDPKSIELRLTYVRAFNKSPGQNSVAFAAPQAPVNRWKIRVPGEGVKVSVTPMIAATQEESSVADDSEPDAADEDSGDGDAGQDESDEDDADDEPEKDADEKETVLLAFVGSAPEVAIRWTAKSEGASGLTALVSAQAIQEVYISEGAVRTRANLNYSISRSQIDQLVVEVPADQKVVNVFDPNVRKWDVESTGDVQNISVELFEPASASQNLTIELEKFVDESMMQEIKTPMVRALNVARQQGTFVLRSDPTLRTETTTREGLLQVDASELPPSLADKTWTLAYRYASTPFELSVSVERIRPRIGVKQLVECYLEPTQISLDTFVVYDIQQAGVFELGLDLPAGFEVMQVRGLAFEGGAAAAVDSYRVEGDNNDRLIVDLARKATGTIGLVVQLKQSINDPNLLSPTGNASTIALPVPEANQQFRNQYSARYVVYAPVSLRLNPVETTGMRVISFGEAFDQVISSRGNRFPSTRPTLAFAFGEQATDLQVEAQRRNPYVTARQMMVVRVDSGVVKFDVTLIYEILYSGVKSLRVDVPSEVASEIRNVSPSIRDAELNPAPDDVADGYVAWELTGEGELIGTQRVQLTWDQKIDELPVGSSVDISVPRLIPMNVDRGWGQIAVTKTETLDVQPTDARDGLRPIDPVHDLMPGVRVADAAAAMEFHDDWNLTIKATRYQLEEMKRTSIERALVRTVVTRSDRRSVAALYRVRSARQRLSVKLPDEAEFDSQPARVNGDPVSLERGDQDRLYIPLIGQDPNSQFVLELRYSVPGNHRRISIPEFPDDPAIQKVYLAVYLPEETSLLESSGPWTEEFEWRHKNSFRPSPQPNASDDELEEWVREGISGGRGPTFQKDGTLYLYSALRPDPPPDGDLRLTVANAKLLSASVIAVLAIIGLLLFRSSGTKKVVAIAVFLIAAVACGVFVPTFGRQLLGLPTYGGLAMVGIVWGARAVTLEARRIKWRRAANKDSKSENPSGRSSEDRLWSKADSGQDESSPSEKTAESQEVSSEGESTEEKRGDVAGEKEGNDQEKEGESHE